MHSYYSIVKVKFVNLKVISVHIGLVFLCVKFGPSEFTFLLNKILFCLLVYRLWIPFISSTCENTLLSTSVEHGSPGLIKKGYCDWLAMSTLGAGLGSRVCMLCAMYLLFILCMCPLRQKEGPWVTCLRGTGEFGTHDGVLLFPQEKSDRES